MNERVLDLPPRAVASTAVGKALGVGIAWVAAGLMLGGCVAVSEEVPGQLDQIGDVEIQTQVCASRPTAVEPCPLGNSNSPATQGDYQLLVAYRILDSVRPPESIGTDPARGADIVLRPSPSYAAELTRLAPPQAGQRWVGYISGLLPYQTAGGEYRARLLARFGLNRGTDGLPFAGPFLHRTIVGYRTAKQDTGRPVECGNDLNTEESDDTVCLDWPSQEELPKNLEFKTRDVGLIAPSGVRSARGTAIAVPFTFQHRGGSGAPAFAMSASTELPGGGATPQVASFVPPQESASPFLVGVEIPAQTDPGTYAVTLRAVLANGQTRIATARIEVLPGADRQAPALALAVAPKLSLKTVRARGLAIDAACSERCTLDARLRIAIKDARKAHLAAARETTIGAGQARIALAGKGSVLIKLTRKAARRLAKVRNLKATVVVTARDTAGNRALRSKRVVLR